MRHARRLLPALLAATVLAAGASAAGAQALAPQVALVRTASPEAPASDLPLVDAALPDAALAKMRGGFDLGGLSFSFGATLNTMVDGQLALQTTVTYAPGGVSTVVTPGAGVTPVMGDQALAQLSGRGITITPGAAPVFATSDGATAFLQGLTRQGLVNATLNTASGRTVTSSSDVTLTIPNGAAFQSGVLNQHLIQSLSDQVALSALIGPH